MASSDPINALISGSFSGMLSVLAGQPLDTVRIRMQTHPGRFKGIAGTVMSTIKEERFMTLYKGVSPAIACAAIENAVVFAANSKIESVYRSIFYSSSSMTSSSMTLWDSAIVGGLSGVFSAIAISPPELIKVRLQADAIRPNGSKEYKNAFDCLVKTARESPGVLGLFRGLPAQLARDIPFNFVFFGSYATVVDSLVKYRQVSSKEQLKGLDLVFAGGLAGVVGWTFTIPMDVIKSKVSCMPVSGSSSLVIDAVKLVLKEEGIRGLFKGWGAACLRAFPSNGALFLGFEMSQRWISSLNAHHHDSA